MQISSFQLTTLIGDVRVALKLLGNDDPALTDAVSYLEGRLDQLRQNIGASDEVDFNRWHAMNAQAAWAAEDDEVCLAAQVLQEVDLALLATFPVLGLPDQEQAGLVISDFLWILRILESQQARGSLRPRGNFFC